MPEHVHLLVSEPRQIAGMPIRNSPVVMSGVDTTPADSYSYPVSTLPSAINDLSVTEKFERLDALWQDIEARAPTLTDEQSAELDRRMAAYEQDPSAVIPWEQVKADLFNR